MKAIRKLMLASLMLVGLVVVGASPASARMPCPEGMSGGTTVWYTSGGVGNTGLQGTTTTSGVICTKDGGLFAVGGRVGSIEVEAGSSMDDPARRLAGGDADHVEGGDLQLNDPCEGGWRYSYFEGGYFYCSKDGIMTYHLVA